MSVKSRFYAEVQERIDSAAGVVLDGRCPDMVAYARTCGIISGLRLAMESFDEVWSASVEVKNELEEMP